MPPVPMAHGGRGPSTSEKLKMGAIMGGTVGSIMGFIYGAVTVFRYGAGPNGIGRTIGQYMITSGTTFGFFMAIGSVIRNESPDSWQQPSHYSRRPIVSVAAPTSYADTQPRRTMGIPNRT